LHRIPLADSRDVKLTWVNECVEKLIAIKKLTPLKILTTTQQ